MNELTPCLIVTVQLALFGHRFEYQTAEKPKVLTDKSETTSNKENEKHNGMLATTSDEDNSTNDLTRNIDAKNIQSAQQHDRTAEVLISSCKRSRNSNIAEWDRRSSITTQLGGTTSGLITSSSGDDANSDDHDEGQETISNKNSPKLKSSNWIESAD